MIKERKLIMIEMLYKIFVLLKELLLDIFVVKGELNILSFCF